MGEVVALKIASREPVARKMPAQFSAEEAEQLMRWCMRIGYTKEELRYAVEKVRTWAETRARAPLKRDWVRTVENAMQDGWALKGCKKWLEMDSRAVNARTGEKIVKRTPITEDYIKSYLEKLARGRDA